jgi:hypothetical protein
MRLSISPSVIPACEGTLSAHPAGRNLAARETRLAAKSNYRDGNI